MNENAELIKYATKTVRTRMNFKTIMKNIKKIRDYRLTHSNRKISINVNIVIKN